MRPQFDFLIVGAGFSGLVAAEQLCSRHRKTCLVVEKRDHIGGNAHDCHDRHGVLIHPYGPHYFRTNSDAILQYLSRFTEWIPGNYRVRSFTDNRYWSFPVNLETFEQLMGRPASREEMERWLESERVQADPIDNSEEAVLSQAGKTFYRMFFEGYTRKQWMRHPRELDASVCGRIPLRTERDDRYFSDKHQVLPKDGYHRIFENLVTACGDRLRLELETDYREIMERVSWRHLIFTGPIDAFFDYRFGPLPYRTLRFEHEHSSSSELPGDPATGIPAGFHQPCVQVNYPGPESYTRCVEAKHITGQQIDGSTLIREYPEPFEPGKEPFYPIPAPETRARYRLYAEAAAGLSDVTFIGRLGTYRYYNMDQVVGMALKTVEKVLGEGNTIHVQ